MSQSDVENLIASIEAYNQGDFDRALTFFHPEIDWRLPPIAPDFTTIRGHNGVRRFWRMGSAVFGDLRLQPVELTDQGHCVVAHLRLVGRGIRSGALTDRDIHAVAEFEDGLIIRLKYFFNREEALEVAGLPE